MRTLNPAIAETLCWQQLVSVRGRQSLIFIFCGNLIESNWLRIVRETQSNIDDFIHFNHVDFFSNQNLKSSISMFFDAIL